MKESFGERLSRLRKQKGLTQDDIARRLNISAQAVSKWENDISCPDISVLLDLADMLNVNVDELLGRDNDTATVVPVEARKDINTMLLKIVVDSANGDKVRVNLPVSILRICMESGMNMPQINGKNALNGIDLQQVYELIENGVIGKLVEVETADGDTVYITVE